MIMAENFEKAGSESSLQNITCSLCLDIFDDATVLPSCGHTFCHKCLKEDDLSHQDPSHMVCPLCMITNKLSANRIDDIHTKETINELVDTFSGNGGEVHAVLERPPNCTACKLQCKAVSFCSTCTTYMCEKCLLCHQHLTSVFEGHKIISIQDIISGNVAIRHKCLIHKQENKDIFCEDCKVCVCFKCVVVDHRNHKIKKCVDFEHELRLKEKDLFERCDTKKSELEKNIQDVEVQRHETHSVMQKLQEDVIQAYSIKAKWLEENQQTLIEEIIALQLDFDEDIDALKSNIRQRLQNISSSMTLMANGRLDLLDVDSLSAYTLLCDELDCMLKEATDHTSAAILSKKAQKRRFVPAGDSCLALGNISEADHESRQDSPDPNAAIGKKKSPKKKLMPSADTRLDLEKTLEADHGPDQDNTTTHIYDTVIKKEAQKKKFKAADDTRLDQRNISAADHGREDNTDHTSAAVVKKKSPKKKFIPSDDTCLDRVNKSESNHGQEETINHRSATVMPVNDTLDQGNTSESERRQEDNTDHTSAAVVKKKSLMKTVMPSDDTRLDRMNISESDHGPEQVNTSAHIYETVIKKKAQKKKVKPAGNTRLDQRISAADHGQEETIYHTYATVPAEDNRLDRGNTEAKPELHVIRCVHLRGLVEGMTKYSDDSVAIGYGSLSGINLIDSAGDTQLYKNIPSETECFDLVFQQDRSLCVSTGYQKVRIYSSKGFRKSTVRVEGNRLGYSEALKLNRGPSDEILITHEHAKQVYIYDPKGTILGPRLRQTLKTKHDAYQASATSSGLIVVSSCTINPSMVTVHDRDGKVGRSLQAPSGVHLYAAVDEHDRVYVASVHQMSGRVVIRLYDIDGLNLKERIQFNALELESASLFLFYFVSLSPELLALASCFNLYFIKISK